MSICTVGSPFGVGQSSSVAKGLAVLMGFYVGKAKSLKSRVRSYFQQGAQHPPKTEALVSEVADLGLVALAAARGPGAGALADASPSI